jgi:hypothetical protein
MHQYTNQRISILSSFIVKKLRVMGSQQILSHSSFTICINRVELMVLAHTQVDALSLQIWQTKVLA